MSCHRLVVPALFVLSWFVDPALAIPPEYLPDDSEAVITVNLRQILASPVAKENKGPIDWIKGAVDERLAELGIQRYLQKIDFDIFRDLDGITVATAGGKSLDFVLLEGTFNIGKIQAAA